MLWWKLQVLETGGIDTGGKCRYRKLQVQLTCVENAGTGKLRYSFNNNETLNYIISTVILVQIHNVVPRHLFANVSR